MPAFSAISGHWKKVAAEANARKGFCVRSRPSEIKISVFQAAQAVLTIERIKKMSKFPLGQVVATPGALEALKDSGQRPADFLDRHARGDWGSVCDEDKRLNDAALVDGSRLLSAYTTLKGTKLWIISEADRSSTCLLLPEEY